MIHLDAETIAAWQRQILRLEATGKCSRTFRRLDPDRQHAVIEAIFAEACEHGPHSMGVKPVADRAGVSVGSLYQYFPRREGMLDFAIDATVGFLTASFADYASSMKQLPLREGLQTYLAVGLDWVSQNTGLMSFFARVAYSGLPGHGTALVRPVAQSMEGLLRALLDGAQARGELRQGLDLQTATRLVLTLTTAVCDAQLMPHLNDYYLLVDSDHPPQLIRDATVEFIVRAIGQPDTTTPTEEMAHG